MIHNFASFVRWRLKPGRWAAKGLNLVADLPRRLAQGERAPSPPSALADTLMRDGYLTLERRVAVPEIDLAAHAGEARGHAFVDLRPAHRDVVDRVAVDLLADPEIGAMIAAYFDGRPWLWNVALNFSEPSDQLLDSQLWHFDYGDHRQLHLMVYFTDVTEECGPFTFLPKRVSDQVTRHPLVIERKTDADLMAEHGIDAPRHVVRLTGTRGQVFVNDPGVLMHQGARCRAERLVLFITFTSRAPMSKGGRSTMGADERARLGRMYAEAAPDGALPRSAFD